MKLGIIGGGRAAWAFGSTWIRLGWPLTGIHLRAGSASTVPEALSIPRLGIDQLARGSDLIMLAVSDSAIADVAEQIPETEAMIFHASGAHAAVRDGFSLHPLRALPVVGEATDLRGATLVFQGACRGKAEEIASAAGCRLVEITAEQKPLYHAAAVFGANYVAVAVDIAERLMHDAGVTDVRDDLVSLAASALANWQRQTGPSRFTGPAARGDRAVLAAHMDALRDQPQLLKIYELLADEIAGSNLASEE